jgi:ABC-type multidrug transport system fused ATPase/permease subunit
VEEKLKMNVRTPAPETKPTLPVSEEVSPLRKEIVLKNLRFQYANADTPIIKKMNLTIQRNSTVAIVGSTGSGKTTIVDIILGLLMPQAGTLLVDGIPITLRNVVSWQKHLGYVPQHIYLADDTLAANIAFGGRPKIWTWIAWSMPHRSPI